MKYLLILFTLIGLTSCFEPSKTQETHVPKKSRNINHKKDTVTSTIESLKSTYKERLSPENKSSIDVKEKVVIEMLSIIPEIAGYSKRIDSISKGKTKLIYNTVERPSAESPYYYIKIDEKSPTDQTTKFQFYVNPVNFSIKVYDPTEDIMMDLDYWQANGDGN